MLRSQELEKDNIKSVILFGSVARGDFDKDSDIDIFIDLYDLEDRDKIKEEAERRLKNFYKSDSFHKWELRGIDNEINLKIGDLDNWKLKDSIISDGISLYGSYKEVPEGDSFILFTFEPIKPVKKRNRVIRNLFGRSDYPSQGLVEEMNGEKLTSRSFVVPKRNMEEVKKVLDDNDVDYSLYELYSSQF
ncbi:MAG: nucleotidyltransferase domain-containing protein [Candidatus Nanohaloarchaeota archaeon QJJ-9]|nr:nucleotidyltransferase domain-containing protein [Candidatus Nanohaloarchaeota archaeon QJJ-9]